MKPRAFADRSRSAAQQGEKKAHDPVEAKQKKEDQLLDRQAAAAEYEAARTAATANMARLRDLRLAREAAAVPAPAKAKASAVKTKKASKVPAKTKTARK